ncbi:MAG: prepilin-type N-terminal cleavage/methylation domain-containing protein [Thermoguttaceae bacterium]|jgi:prepilin-type N-terminal cleavage/methylation domain-containing protein
MKRGRGFTLIEMLVAVTVGATLAGIAVLLLYALMKSHNSGREHLEYCQTLNRLAEQFRGDVHSMQKTSPDATETLFDLLPNTADDTRVRYQCLEGRIDRSELQGEKIVRRESYMLPQDMMAAIKTEALGEATVAVIVITPKEQTEKIYRAGPVRIEAVLGRDWRLSKALPKASTEDKP